MSDLCYLEKTRMGVALTALKTFFVEPTVSRKMKQKTILILQHFFEVFAFPAIWHSFSSPRNIVKFCSLNLSEDVFKSTVIMFSFRITLTLNPSTEQILKLFPVLFELF